MRYYTHSEIATFSDCRRRWWLGTYRRLRPRFRKVTGAAPIGTRIHSALGPYYVPDNMGPVDPRETLERVIAEDRHALLESVAAHMESGHFNADAGWMDDVAASNNELTEFEKEADLCRAMIAGYMEWLAETGADSDFEVVLPSEQAVEYEFAPGESLLGRLDAQVMQISTGAHLGVDHKTGDFASLRSTLRREDQMLRYEILRRTRMPHARSDGMMFNLLKKVKRSVSAKPPFYDRMTVNFNAHQLESAWIRTMAVINDIREAERRLLAGESHQTVAYPRKTRDCSWRCEFFNCCDMFDDGSRVDDMIESYYEVSDPLSRYPELTGGSE